MHFDPLTREEHTSVAGMLKLRYERRDDAFVGANMLVYDVPDNARSQLVPDLFVVFGVAKRPIRDWEVFRLWEERVPVFVLEFTSPYTHRVDTEVKRRRYAAWGVAEYFLYDPPSKCQSAPLRGLSLAGGAYREMSERLLPNGEYGYHSDALGLGLWMDDLEGAAELRMYDPVSGTNLRSRWPRLARMRADAEAARRGQAEARVRELEAQLRAKREGRAVEPNGVTFSSTGS